MLTFGRQATSSSDQEIIYESNEIEENFDINKANLPFNLTNNENIVQSSLNPGEAFQYFHKFAVPIEGKHYFQTNTERHPALETPWEKYYRLQSELEELKTNLNAIELVHEEKKASMWSILQEKTEQLLIESQEVGRHSAWQHVPRNKSDSAPPSVSTDLLNEILTKFQTKHNNNEIIYDGQSEGQKREEAKIEFVQSMYHQISSSYSERLLSLERKITSLETLLGIEMNESLLFEKSQGLVSIPSNDSSSRTTFPVLSTIHRLEQKVDLLDLSNHSTNFELYRNKLSLLKIELEHITTSASLGNVPSSGKAGVSDENSPMKLLEIYHKIETFLEQFALVQSMIPEIPAMIIRLKTLENIHWSANLFVNRLEHLENDILSINQDLQSNKQVLNELKSSLTENLQIMKANMEKLEGKVQK